MPKEKINLNIDVSTLLANGREVKLPFLKCEALAYTLREEEDISEKLEPIRGLIDIEVRDCKGIIVKKGRHKMRSFVNNFMKVLEAFIRARGGVLYPYGGLYCSASIVKPDGSSATIAIEYYPGDTYGGGTAIALVAPDNDASYGIVVGSGTTTVDLNNYALASQIPHGSGSGQLDYDAVSISDLGLDTSVSPPVYRIRLVRGFKNLSGGDVTINEVGLIARNYWKRYNVSAGVGYIDYDVKYMIARDVLPTSYTVPSGGSAVVAVTVEVVLG